MSLYNKTVSIKWNRSFTVIFAIVLFLNSFIVVPNIESATTIKAKKITLTAKKLTLKVGQKQTLKIKSMKPKGAKKAVTWKSSRKAIVSINTKGRVKALKVGNATITAISKSNKKVKTTCSIKVKKASPSSNKNPSFPPMKTPAVTPLSTPATNPPLPPTVSPTIKPTANPPLLPTVSPTIKPTASPTLSPTVSPMVSPTIPPTASPVSTTPPDSSSNPPVYEVNLAEPSYKSSGVTTNILDDGTLEITFDQGQDWKNIAFSFPVGMDLSNYMTVQIDATVEEQFGLQILDSEYNNIVENYPGYDITTLTRKVFSIDLEPVEGMSLTNAHSFNILSLKDTKFGVAKHTPILIHSIRFTYAIRENLRDASTGSSLKEAYSNYFTIGVASGNSKTNFFLNEVLPMMKHQYNSFTFENELKPEALLLQEESQNDANGYPCINEDEIDRLLNFAKNHNLSVRGHVLIWHSQTPDWFFNENFSDNGAKVSKEVMRNRMEQYIKKILTYTNLHFPDVIYAWDVVNEAVSDNGGYRTGEEGSLWYEIYGDESFIEDAFRFAKQYKGENVTLFYNEYNTHHYVKRQTILELLNNLKQKDLIDGMGMQGHISLEWPNLDTWRETIELYGDTGLDLQITELDINNLENTDSAFNQQAEHYENIFQIILDAKISDKANITNVTFWGICDAVSWLYQNDPPSFPLIFDINYKKKEAYERLIKLPNHQGGSNG